MKHDPSTPCTSMDDVFGGQCAATPTDRFLVGPRCRPHAPGATLDGCRHGTPWTDDCARCAGAPPTIDRPRVSARGLGAYGPSADYSGLTVPMKQGRKWAIREWVEPAHRSLIKQRTDLNRLAHERAQRRTTT